MKKFTHPAGVPADFVADLYEAAIEQDGMRGLSALVAKEVGAETGTMWVVDSGDISKRSPDEALAKSGSGHAACRGLPVSHRGFPDFARASSGLQ